MSVEDQVLEIMLPVITADPVSIFKDKTSTEAQEFLEQRTAVEHKWKEIIQNGAFLGCCFEKREGGSLYLTTSVRKPQWWQLSSFGCDGIPSYHEDYEKSENGDCGGRPLAELYKALVLCSIRHQVVVRIRKKGEKDADGHNYGMADRAS